MLLDFSSALDELAATSRALLVTGAGPAFCSGAALNDHGSSAAVDREKRDAGLVLETHYIPLILKLRDLPIPWMSAVRGAVAGIGASLALAADLVVASETAFFLLAFSKVGLIPDGGVTHLLVRTIGRARAMEMMMLAERLPAERALQWGLVNRVVADGRLEEEAMKLATRLADGPSVCFGLIRQNAWLALDAPFDTVLQQERRAQTTAGRTKDFDEGLAAFNANRAASFTGS